MAVFSRGLHIVKKAREASGVSSMRALIPPRRALSLWPGYLPRAHLSMPSHWGLGFNICIWCVCGRGRGTNFPSTAMIFLKYNSNPIIVGLKPFSDSTLPMIKSKLPKMVWHVYDLALALLFNCISPSNSPSNFTSCHTEGLSLPCSMLYSLTLNMMFSFSKMLLLSLSTQQALPASTS